LAKVLYVFSVSLLIRFVSISPWYLVVLLKFSTFTSLLPLCSLFRLSLSRSFLARCLFPHGTLSLYPADHLPPESLGMKHFLESMLVLDPAQRWTAEMALAGPFFANGEEPEDLPRIRIPECHGAVPVLQCRDRCVRAPTRTARLLAPLVLV
jgi:serine/threonine protein kinase